MRIRKLVDVVEKPKETCHHGTPTEEWHGYAINEESYIHEHLATLNFIAKAFNCQNVLEIGTGNGDSTIALANAMQQTGGIVTTIDIEDKGLTIDKLWDEGLGHKVNFIKGDSHKDCPQGAYDLVLIDGDHSEDGLKGDIEAVLPNGVQEGGFVIFHDTNNPAWEVTRESIFKYTKSFWDDFEWYEWFNCNGLIVIRRKE